MPELLKRITEPIAGLRSIVAWRFFGVVVAELVLMTVVGADHGPSGIPSLGLIATGASAVLLILGGPRIVSLFALAVSGSFLLVEIAAGHTNYQLAEEFLPFALLPAVACLLAAWTGRTSPHRSVDLIQRESDEAQISLFRLAAVCMMIFAALHKLNLDFFDPTVSCATSHASRFLNLLGPGPAIVGAIPLLAILTELAVPALLVFAARLGLPAVIAIMFYIGHRGATPFTQLIMMLAITFLDEADLRMLLDFIRRRWIALAALLLLLTGASTAVLHGQDWPRYYPWILITATLTFGALGLLGSRLLEPPSESNTGGLLGRLRAQRVRARLFPKERGARIVLMIMTCALVLNGMSPYFGTKFRLSFAMFSNLRVDDGSWNSLIFPKTLRFSEHDEYLHVTQKRVAGHRQGEVLDGLYRRGVLEQRLMERRRNAERFDLLVRYRGDEREFKRAPTNVELSGWLRTLPDDHLLHDFLPPSSPQSCLH